MVDIARSGFSGRSETIRARRTAAHRKCVSAGSSGSEAMSSITYRDAVGKALQDSMRAESRLILIGQNLAAHSLKALAEEFGTARIRDTSISESAMVGMAVGAE